MDNKESENDDNSERLIATSKENPLYQNYLTSQHQINDIFIFAAHGNLNKCMELVTTFGTAVLNMYSDTGVHVLHSACVGGFIDIVVMVLTQGAFVTFEEFNNALNDNNQECIKIDPCIVTRNKDKNTPIHFASSHNRVEVIELLLNIGVPIDVLDGNERTPLLLSLDTGRTESTILLLARGADINLTDNEKDNCLHWAAQKGSIDHIYLFLNLGLDINQPDSFLMAPIHIAAVTGNVSTIQALFSANPNLTSRDSKNRTPLDVAIEKENARATSEISFHINKHSLYNRIFNSKLMWKIFQIYFALSALFYMYSIISTKSMSGAILFIQLISLTVFIILLVLLYSIKKIWIIFCLRNKEQYLSYIYSCNSFSKIKEMLALHYVCHVCAHVSDKNTYHCPHLNKCIEDYEVYDPLLDMCITKRSRSNYIKLCVMYNVFNLLAVVFLLLNNMIYMLIIWHILPLIQGVNRIFYIYLSYRDNISIKDVESGLLHNETCHKH